MFLAKLKKYLASVKLSSYVKDASINYFNEIIENGLYNERQLLYKVSTTMPFNNTIRYKMKWNLLLDVSKQ